MWVAVVILDMLHWRNWSLWRHLWGLNIDLCCKYSTPPIWYAHAILAEILLCAVGKGNKIVVQVSQQKLAMGRYQRNMESVWKGLWNVELPEALSAFCNASSYNNDNKLYLLSIFSIENASRRIVEWNKTCQWIRSLNRWGKGTQPKTNLREERKGERWER